MKNLRYIILSTALFCFIGIGNASLSKSLFLKKKPDKSFVVSSKSRTVKLAKGQTYHIKMKLKKNRYYFLSINGERKLGNIQYKIIDPKKNNEVIFDNSAYELCKEMTFQNNEDREVIVEVKTMPCCFDNELQKKRNVKLLFANKRLNKNEESNFNNSYNLYAIN